MNHVQGIRYYPFVLGCSTNVYSLSPPTSCRNNTLFLIIDLFECCYLSFLIQKVLTTTLRIKLKIFSIALFKSLVHCHIPHSQATVTSFQSCLLTKEFKMVTF